MRAIALWMAVGVYVLGMVMLGACGSDSGGTGELARVNDHVITLEEFNEEMESLPVYVKPLVVNREGKKEFLSKMVERELLLQQAEKKGLDRDKKILYQVEQFRKQLMVQSLLEDLYRGKDMVADKEITEYYHEHKEKFFVGERLRLRHIVVNTRAEAEAIEKGLRNGEDFAELARRYSMSPNRERGGDLGYVEKGQVGEAFEKAAFSLEKRGAVSDIVETSYGYHLIRLEDRKEAYQRTLEEVRDEIRLMLREQKRDELLAAYLEELRKKSRIDLNESLLEETKSGQ